MSYTPQGTNGQATSANSAPVVISSDQSTILVDDSAKTAPLGAVTETAPASDTASSGLNGRLQRIAQNLSGENTLIGAATETAPASDTASSGLNGRLQRIAQNLTSWISLLPTSLGNKTAANSLAVTIASDQVEVASKIADGSDVALGAKADSSATSDTGTFSLLSLFKRFLSNSPKAINVDNATLSNFNPTPIGGVARDLTSITPYTDGDAAMAAFEYNTGAMLVNQADLSARYDGVTWSEAIKKVSIEITRPADTTAYSVEDMIGTGAFNMTNISGPLATSDGSGYCIGARLISNEVNLIGKRLTLLVIDAGTGSYSSTDNTMTFTGDYAIDQDILFRVNFDNIVDSLGNPSGTTTDSVECEFYNLRLAYKLTSYTKFNIVLITRDAFTPTASSTFYIELTLSTNP